MIKLETMYQLVKEERAAIKIQGQARRLISKNMFNRLMLNRIEATTKLQRAWRRRNNKTDILYLIKAFKNMNATKIQRYMKGYHVSQQLLM